jgi:hypothetical protein
MHEVGKLFFDASFGLVGKEKFKEKVKRKGINFSDEEIDNFFRENAVIQMNKKVKKGPFYKTNAPHRCFQVDVIFFGVKKRKYLVCVDILSRKAFVYRIRRSLLWAIKKFKNDVGRVVGLTGDHQFASSDIVEFSEKMGINLYTNVAKEDHRSVGSQLGVVNRFVRTLRNKINMYVAVNGGDERIIINDVVDGYNDSVHSGLYGHYPNEVFEDAGLLYMIQKKNNEHNRSIKQDLKIGDFVRVMEEKKVFDKEGLNFGKDVYRVCGFVGRRVVLCDGQFRKFRELLKI